MVAIGDVVGGRYRLVRVLAEGARGATFEARDDAGRALAVKIVPRAATSDEALARVIRVARALRASPSPHLVPIVDVAIDAERDLVAVVSPLLPGVDLARRLRELGPLSPDAAARVVAEACAAIGEARALGETEGAPRASDVFLESIGGGDAIAVRLVDPGLPLDRTRRGSVPSAHDDVRALGALLAECLTGTPLSPSAASVVEVRAEATSLLASAPWVGADVAGVVARSVDPDPSRAVESVVALREALRATTGGDTRLTSAMLAPLDDEARSAVARASPGSAAAASDAPEAARGRHVGRVLGGRYRVVREIGQGGMGTVYEVESTAGERFAAKVVSRDVTHGDDAVVARFLREGRAAMRIQHPNVARTIEIGTDLDLGAPFIVMELLVGRNLASIMKERGALEPPATARVFADAARGLAAAHAQGIVHRDVKPENLFLDVSSGAVVVKVCDFGLAKAVGEEASRDLTRSGGVLGTPRYMSPEQALSSKNVGFASDVWSLCASLFEALAGSALWQADGIGELMVAICTKPARSLRDAAPWVGAELVDLVAHGLAREPEARGTMEALAAGLERAARAGPIGLDALATVPESASAAPPARSTEAGGSQAAHSISAARVTAATQGSRRASASPARRAGLAVAGAVAVAGAAAALASRGARTGVASAPPTSAQAAIAALAGPEARLACPIFEVRGADDVAVRLGAAAATVACMHARWWIGGGDDRALPPAALLDAPREPVAGFADPYVAPEQRARTVALAKERAPAYLDGVVTRDGDAWRVETQVAARDGSVITRGEGRDREYIRALRAALAVLWRAPLPARAIDPDVKAWTGFPDADAGRLHDDVLLLSDTSGCADMRSRGASLGNAYYVLERCCQVLEPPDARDAGPPALDESSPAALATSTRALTAWGVRLPEDRLRAVASRLDDAREQEPTRAGRARLAYEASEMWSYAGDAERSHAAALVAVREEPLLFEAWYSVITVTVRSGSNEAAMGVASTWFPSEPGFLAKLASLRADERDARLRAARLAYVLEPDAQSAARLARVLAEVGRPEEARAVVATMATPAPAWLTAYVEATIDLHDAKLGRAIPRLESVGPRALVDLVLAAQIAGAAEDVATRWTERFLAMDDAEAAPVAQGYAAAMVLCMRARGALAARGLDRIDRLGHAGPNWWGEGGEALLAGARRYAAGDLRGAAAAWRPLVAGPTVTLAMLVPTEPFVAVGERELAARLDARKMPFAFVAGVSEAAPREATRALAEGRREDAERLARAVVDAWEVADVDVPAVAEMRRLEKRLAR